MPRFEYDAFGNVLKQTLAYEPTAENPPVTESTYAVECVEEGVSLCIAQMRCNAAVT